MLLESLSQMVLRWLRIPPGTTVRSGKSTSTTGQVSIENNDYVQAILDITVDDICIGEEPLSVNYMEETPDDIKLKLEDITKEFNDIVKDVARDLCLSGLSLYKAELSKDKKLLLIPYLEDVDIYLDKTKKVRVYEKNEANTGRKSQVKDLIIFINYNKSSLTKIEDGEKLDKSLAFKIAPTPMQLKNAQRTVTQLETAENAILRYRSLLRAARWVNVDLGITQGDQEQNTVDSIASAINANSMSLTPTGDINEFDDNLPVIPNRKGIGKPEIVSEIPDVNIKDIADIDYYVGKLSLVSKFPTSYIDFSKELGSTAVSTLRSDIRYFKMCRSVGTKITSTINDWVNESEKFRKYEPAFVLTQLPSSEDEDVMAALDNYIDISNSVEEFIGGADTVEGKLHRLQLLQDMFASSTTSPMLQKWFEDYREFIKSDASSEQEDLDEFGEGSDRSPRGADVDIPEGPESDEVEINPENEVEETDLNPANDVEFIEPQTE